MKSSIILKLIMSFMIVPLSYISAAKEPKEEAQLIYYEGKAEAKRAGKKVWEDVKLKMMLYPKDRVRTRLQSKIELKLPDNSIVNIGENTTFDIQKLFTDSKSNTKKYLFKLFSGDLVGKIEKLKKGDTFEIETPVALVGFRGTTVFIHVKPNGETWVGLKSGLGYVRSIKTGGEKIIEESNYHLLSTDGAFTESGIISGSDYERFEDLEKNKDELLKKGGITPPKIIAVEKEKEATYIRGMADPENTIQMVSSGGQSKTTKSDESGYFSFEVDPGGDNSPPVIKITTSEFGKRSTNNKNLKIAGLVNDRSSGSDLSYIFTSMNQNGEKSAKTVYKSDTSQKRLKFFVNGREIRLISGMVNSSYMLNEGKNVLEFRAVDRAGNESKLTKVVYLDTRPPNLISFNITPNPVNFEESVEILIEAEDDYSGMKKNLILNLYNPKGNSYQLVMPYDYTTKKYRLKVKAYDYLGKRAEGSWKASVRLEDTLGNKSMKYFRGFRVIDLPPPPPDKIKKRFR